MGKTFSLQQLGKNHFQNVVLLNLEKNPDFHPTFAKNLDAKRILSEIELISQSKIIPGQTLLIIDEIQACPTAIMALRYFYEDFPRLHVVATGSLLDFALSQISFPVGRIQLMEMTPLSFAEFLTALGQGALLGPMEKMARENSKDISPTVHQLLLDELKKYFFVGGMPEAVKAFIDHHSFRDCFEVHAEIISTYRHDFSKYKPQVDERALELVLKGVAKTVGSQIIYSKLGTGFTQPTLKKAFDLLSKACLVTPVSSTSHAGLPLGAALSKRTKALLVDIGLMHHLCGLSADVEFLKNDLLDLYEGRMAEQFVGQELRSFLGNELFYWSRAEKSSSAEVDYLLGRQGQVIPIEVKAGAAGRLKSLHLFLSAHPETKYGLVLSSSLPSELKEQKLRFLPLYLAGMISLD